MGNLYFTTANGIHVAPGITDNKWRSAGLPRPWIDTFSSGSVVVAGYAVTLGAARQRAYRVTIGWYDDLGNFLESAPSEPFTIVGSGGVTTTPHLVVKVPLGLPPGAFVRAWRSA